MTCFSSQNRHQTKYQNTVLAQCTSTVFWYLARWWFSEPKHVAEFLILITNICCVTDWINYCIIAKHNRMAPIKNDFLTHKLLYSNASIIMTTCTYLNNNLVYMLFSWLIDYCQMPSNIPHTIQINEVLLFYVIYSINLILFCLCILNCCTPQKYQNICNF